MPRSRAVLFVRFLGALSRLVLLVPFAACLAPTSQTCGDGSVCPAGMYCIDTAGTATSGRVCATGVCGNGSIDAGESCDDGNNLSGDGCPADCSRPCGDGVRDPIETCDDGNTQAGDGCASDCSGLDGLLRVSPPRVTFTAAEGGASPSAMVVRVQLARRGDTVLVSAVPGESLPSWLSVVERAASGLRVELELRPNSTAQPGEFATLVRLAIGWEGAVEIFDLPVSYRVAASDLAASVVPSILQLTAVAGEMDPVTQAFAVHHNGDSVTVISAPSWLTVSPSSSTQAGVATFVATFQNGGLGPETHLEDVLEYSVSRGSVTRRLRIVVLCDIIAAPPLELTITPPALVFHAVSGGELPVAQSVTATFNAPIFTIEQVPPWLNVIAPPAPLRSPTSFAVMVNSTAFPARAVVAGSIRLQIGRFGNLYSSSIPVTYYVEPLPELHFASPYAARVARSGTLVVRGWGLPTDAPVTIQLGDLLLPPAMAESSTQVTVSYPPLPVGRYPLTLQAPAAVSPFAPELVVVADPPPSAYQAIPLTGPFKRLLYDAERRTLYGVNVQEQRLERFRQEGGAWVALAPYFVPQLVDVAMIPNGRSLVVVQSQMVNEMPLTGEEGNLVPLAALPNEYDSFFDIEVANSGKLFARTRCQEFFCDSLVYDLRDHTLSWRPWFDGAVVGSADGGRIYGTDRFAELGYYESSTDAVRGGPVQVLAGSFSVSGDSSRVLVDQAKVYDSTLRVIGNLWYRTAQRVLLSRDSSKAFAYVPSFSPHTSTKLEIYDLRAPLQAGARYPLLRTIEIPYDATLIGHPLLMTSNLDDSVVFVSGSDKLLVVPVQP